MSDHCVIILQVDFDRTPKVYPFKLNPTWLAKDSFDDFVRSLWGLISGDIPTHLNPLKSFLYKLNKLQSKVLRWGK